MANSYTLSRIILKQVIFMGRFNRVLRALIIEEYIDINGIIKAIETVISEDDQEKILEELCSYVGYDTTPDQILEYHMMS